MFAINGRNLPRAGSYQEATRCYHGAHQHARLGDWRGLKDKRDTSKRVRLSSTGAVLFRLHETVVVAWHPDQVRVICYDSKSTVTFANQFLPHGLCAEIFRGEMCVRKTSTGERYIDRGAHQPLLFDLVDGDWVVQPESVLRHQHVVVDHKLAYKVRKALKPFCTWLQVMQRIGALQTERTIPRPELIAQLRPCLLAGEIPASLFGQMGAYEWGVTDFDQLRRQCQVVAGAVTRAELPLGQLPKKKCPYADLPAWRYV